MTLPPIGPLCGDNNNSSALPLRDAARRKQPCLSAAFADQPAKRERRRAICSWSVGYGTLSHPQPHYHPQQLPPTPPPPPSSLPPSSGEKVAEGSAATSLLLGSNRRQPAIHAAAAAAVPVHQGEKPTAAATARRNLLTMPGLKSLVSRRRNSGSAEPSSVPLVRRNGSSSNLVRSAASLANLRKCETVLALTGVLRTSSSSSDLEPIRPVNRLREVDGSHSRICSRCSSLLSLASTSRYSLDAAGGGFVQVPKDDDASRTILCKLCLVEVPFQHAIRLQQCNCSFCSECMKSYVEFEIAEGAYDISCPDAQCPAQGMLLQDEIKRLVGDEMLEKHLKYRLNREVEIDKNRMWCPRAGCETVCTLCPPSKKRKPQCVHCPRCAVDFCSSCKLEWHQDLTCEEYNKQLAKQGRAEETGIPFDSDLIKCCPMCNVPIEKDEGCAQMMCKRCKHVFCWYCLASLDDDFLLRHYDKGPCKNKLGHSRASVIWHRTQVIGIFAGFGILLLVASPLLLLAAPCIVCCKCRVCNAGTTKLDNEDEFPGEGN